MVSPKRLPPNPSNTPLPGDKALKYMVYGTFYSYFIVLELLIQGPLTLTALGF